MTTRLAVLLVGGLVLLVAAPFALLAWAFGGPADLAVFTALLVGLLGVCAGLGAVLLKVSGQR